MPSPTQSSPMSNTSPVLINEPSVATPGVMLDDDDTAFVEAAFSNSPSNRAIQGGGRFLRGTGPGGGGTSGGGGGGGAMFSLDPTQDFSHIGRDYFDSDDNPASPSCWECYCIPCWWRSSSPNSAQRSLLGDRDSGTQDSGETTPPTSPNPFSLLQCCQRWCHDVFVGNQRLKRFTGRERISLPRLSSVEGAGMRRASQAAAVTSSGGGGVSPSPTSPPMTPGGLGFSPSISGGPLAPVNGLFSRYRASGSGSRDGNPPPHRSVSVSSMNHNLDDDREGVSNGGPSDPEVYVSRRIVLLGARNSGKSSVAFRFAEHRFENEYDPTIENTLRAKIKVEGVSFLVDLLDTAGLDEYSNFSRHAAVGVHGYCMVFSVTSLQSFYAIQTIHDRITDLVGMFTVPIILVGTKTDDDLNREVSKSLAQELASAWGCWYVECSAKNDTGISDVFVSLLRQVEIDSGLISHLGAGTEGILEARMRSVNAGSGGGGPSSSSRRQGGRGSRQRSDPQATEGGGGSKKREGGCKVM